MESVEIADRVGAAYSRYLASLSIATTHFLNAEYAASEALGAETLTLVRTAETALDYQSFWLAVVADSCLARGDADAAIGKAREGIKYAEVGFQTIAEQRFYCLRDTLVKRAPPVRQHGVVGNLSRSIEFLS